MRNATRRALMEGWWAEAGREGKVRQMSEDADARGMLLWNREQSFRLFVDLRSNPVLRKYRHKFRNCTFSSPLV